MAYFEAAEAQFNTLISKTEGLNQRVQVLEESAKADPQEIDYSELASEIDYGELVDGIEVDYGEIVDHLDMDALAESVANSLDTDSIAERAAGSLDVEDVARAIDMSDLADSIDLESLAGVLTENSIMRALAERVDTLEKNTLSMVEDPSKVVAETAIVEHLAERVVALEKRPVLGDLDKGEAALSETGIMQEIGKRLARAEEKIEILGRAQDNAGHIVQSRIASLERQISELQTINYNKQAQVDKLLNLFAAFQALSK